MSLTSSKVNLVKTVLPVLQGILYTIMSCDHPYIIRGSTCEMYSCYVLLSLFVLQAFFDKTEINLVIVIFWDIEKMCSKIMTNLV